MTNTESRSNVEIDELPPWDDESNDAETLDRLAEQLSAARTRELEVYGLDSDKQTLVGIGPIERARRSREAWTVPDSRHLAQSERMPQSEPPGPFIADDDEPPPSFRKRRVGGWMVTLPVAAIALLATGAIVSNNAPQRTPSKLAAAIKAPQARALDVASPEPAPVSAEQLPQETESSAANKDEGSGRERAVTKSAETLPVNPSQPQTPPSVDASSDIVANAGTLNVTSSPPANVVLDGRPLGKAPRVVQVPAGPHTLVFIHPSYGRRSLNVTVRPGATTGASAVF